MTEAIRQCVFRLIEEKSKLPKDVAGDSFKFIGSGHANTIGIIKFMAEIEFEFVMEISELDMVPPEFRIVGGFVASISKNGRSIT